MAIGIQPSVEILNAQAGQIALNARNALQSIVFFAAYLESIGGLNGLTALGFTTDDATDLLTIFTDLNAIAQTCMGEAYTGPALPFNFLGAATPLFGGN